MDQYPFGDENAVHLEMHLPGFSESQGLVCSEVLNHDLCLNAKDVMYAGLSGLDVVPGLPAVDAASHALEADLNTLSLYPAKDCDSVQLLDEPGSRPSQHGERTGLCVLSYFKGCLTDQSSRRSLVALCRWQSPLRGRIFGVKRWIHVWLFKSVLGSCSLSTLKVFLVAFYL